MFLTKVKYLHEYISIASELIHPEGYLATIREFEVKKFSDLIPSPSDIVTLSLYDKWKKCRVLTLQTI